MSRFRLHGRFFSRIAGIAGGLLIFCMICGALNYVYVPTDNSALNWARMRWHYLYEDKGKIENLYIGSSHVYSGINPLQLDEINGKYNFNLATSGLPENGAYYFLKEAGKYNDLSHVYLELYYLLNVTYSTRDYMDFAYQWNWQNTDYMKNSLDKVSYMLSIAGTEKYIDIVLPFTRYRASLDNWELIRQTLQNKKLQDYCTYKIESAGEKGYASSANEFEDAQRLYYQERILDRDLLGEKSEKYIRKIIVYCKEQEIPITLFIVPIDALQLVSTKNYDEYIRQIREIAEEYDVEFYDFNLVKEEYLPIQDGKYFRDSGHLNIAGANMFTPFFSMVVENSPEENEKYFHDSYVEKLNADKPAIYGLYCSDSEEERTYWIASNREDGLEYKVTIQPAPDEFGGGTEQLTIQDYSKNKEFALPKDEHGICILEARKTGEKEPVQVMTINY